MKRVIHPKEPNPVGRPWFDGKDEKDVVAKLDQAFAIDCQVVEALSYADISKDSYYRYLEAHPELRDRFDKLRERPVLKARQTIVNKIGENYHDAMDYLKRKRRLEFGDNVDITTEGEGVIGIAGLIKQIEDSNKSYGDTHTED